MNSIESKKIIVSNYLINYNFKIVNNSNINLIFIHGWLSSASIFNNLIDQIDFANCYSIDLVGFGNSQKTKEPLNNDFYTELVNEFIQKLNLSNIILIGHSNGGAISTKFTYKYKNKVSKLVLISASGIRENKITKMIIKKIANIISPLFKLPLLKSLKFKIYKLLKSDYLLDLDLKETYKNIVDEDISNIYKDINCKTLLIWGNKDTSTPLKYGKYINNQIKNSSLNVLNGDHFVFLKHSKEVAGMLKDFIL